MFLSCEWLKYLGFDKATGKYRYEYKIIDTDFEEAARADALAVAHGAEVGVIETYRKRNLPVVPNLIRYMQYTASRHSYWSLDKQIELNRKHNPYFPEYENEINKYLLLL